MLKARASSPRKAKAVTEKSNLGMGRKGGREAVVCSAQPPEAPLLQGDPPQRVRDNIHRFLQMCTCFLWWWPGKAESEGGFFLTRDSENQG